MCIRDSTVALAAREAAERPDDITVLAVRLEEAR